MTRSVRFESLLIQLFVTWGWRHSHLRQGEHLTLRLALGELFVLRPETCPVGERFRFLTSFSRALLIDRSTPVAALSFLGSVSSVTLVMWRHGWRITYIYSWPCYAEEEWRPLYCRWQRPFLIPWERCWVYNQNVSIPVPCAADLLVCDIFCLWLKL